ncbi:MULTISPECIES: class I SAM-dependent methyltransferase [Haloferax]|uniref:Demethylmenaquinone methyltransferase n=1 Tax=Haloferax massiliensis TaxID=1476858 RepID=A0A0D6JTQ9_9EURY|nr:MULTISPECIES: methyltransferase domain-containing protein [Haloferax]MDS0242071.1 methyltransferase domain-containing protein [Haloferax sp. S2CR25]MDS0445192.1 methyltransferase domain-containing protein [Haloferax sp. S2CR25-2]CQR50960.1 Demethylmenaquinone methyltransferase [Haloferax massiliensis]
MWDDSRAALADLDLGGRTRILDVGCGTGEFTRVLAEAADARVVGVDADTDLLSVAADRAGIEAVAGDATRLPFAADSFDLVVCQALLVNLPDPTAALSEFARVSSDLVATVEPDNAAVGVDSTVEAEAALDRRVRDAFRDGVATDVALGDRVRGLFADAGLSVVGTRRYHHRKLTEPPYDDHDVRSAAKKATGEGLDRHEADLRRGLDDDSYESVRREWREMGREVVQQIRDGEYRRAEVVPFDVTTGRV